MNGNAINKSTIEAVNKCIDNVNELYKAAEKDRKDARKCKDRVHAVYLYGLAHGCEEHAKGILEAIKAIVGKDVVRDGGDKMHYAHI